MENKIYAVITGDIIGSTRLTSIQRDKLTLKLKELFEILKKDKKKNGTLRSIEIFRGDSFQSITEKPELSLRIALMIRCFLRSTILDSKNRKSGSDLNFLQHVDARVAIGVGRIISLKTKLAESGGEAFTFSGHLLDEMKNEKYLKIGIKTSKEELNDDLWKDCILLNAIISKWSSLQCEVVYQKLSGQIEDEIAKKLKASQPAINFRSKTANWQAVDHYLKWFEKKFKNPM